MIIKQDDLLWGQHSPVLSRERLNSTLSEGNIPKWRTGLPYNIWLDNAGSDRNVRHNKPRLKVHSEKGLIPVSIEDRPQILVNKKIKKFAKVSSWMVNHLRDLIRHWNGEIDDKGFIGTL